MSCFVLKPFLFTSSEKKHSKHFNVKILYCKEKSVLNPLLRLLSGKSTISINKVDLLSLIISSWKYTMVLLLQMDVFVYISVLLVKMWTQTKSWRPECINTKTLKKTEAGWEQMNTNTRPVPQVLYSHATFSDGNHSLQWCV